MKFTHLLAAGTVLSAFVIAAPTMAQNSYPTGNGDRVDANGMPTTHSTPAEHAATADLNAQISNNNAQADAQSQQNNAQYQQQLQQHDAAMQQNQAAQQHYEDQTIAYQNLRARYAAERAAYHRGVWPDRYTHWVLEENDAHLIGQRVEIINGDRVGTVTDVAHTPTGRVLALRVALDNDKVVWIDQADVRYDRADGIVMTNLDRADLRHMADERL